MMIRLVAVSSADDDTAVVRLVASEPANGFVTVPAPMPQVIAPNKWQRHDKFEEVDFWTPQRLFDVFNAHYGPVDVDVAASAENAKADRFLAHADDALSCAWQGRIAWCNPPYERSTSANAGMAAWAAKAHEETSRADGTLEAALLFIPCYTDSIVFHLHVLPYAHEIIFVRSRVKFTGPHANGGTSRNPSMLVVYRRGPRLLSSFPLIGSCYRSGDDFRPPLPK